METKEKTDKEKTYEEKQEKILKELYGCDYAERTKTVAIRKNTRAALYVKGLIKDLESALFSLNELLYGETDEKQGERIVNAIRPIDAIADGYLIDSISENMSFRDFKEI